MLGVETGTFEMLLGCDFTTFEAELNRLFLLFKKLPLSLKKEEEDDSAAKAATARSGPDFLKSWISWFPTN